MFDCVFAYKKGVQSILTHRFIFLQEGHTKRSCKTHKSNTARVLSRDDTEFWNYVDIQKLHYRRDNREEESDSDNVDSNDDDSDYDHHDDDWDSANESD